MPFSYLKNLIKLNKLNKLIRNINRKELEDAISESTSDELLRPALLGIDQINSKKSLKFQDAKHAVFVRLINLDAWISNLECKRYFEIYTFLGEHQIAGWFRWRLLINSKLNSVRDRDEPASLELSLMCHECDEAYSSLLFCPEPQWDHARWQSQRLSNILKSSLLIGRRNLSNLLAKKYRSHFTTLQNLKRNLACEDVLLIGPASSATDSDFVLDVLARCPQLKVIRIGDIGLDSVNLPSIASDITFLRNHKIENFSPDELGKVLSDKLAILSNCTTQTLAMVSKQHLDNRVFLSPIWGEMESGYEFNAAPELLLVLFQCGVRKVYVTGCDLFCSFESPAGYKRHPSKFNSEVAIDRDLHHRIMAINHPITIQFEIWWLFYTSGFISCDGELNALLNSGIVGYLKRMTDIYG